MARIPEELGMHYEFAYPGRQLKTARNLRRLPLQEQVDDRVLLAGLRCREPHRHVFPPRLVGRVTAGAELVRSSTYVHPDISNRIVNHFPSDMSPPSCGGRDAMQLTIGPRDSVSQINARGRSPPTPRRSPASRCASR